MLPVSNKSHEIGSIPYIKDDLACFIKSVSRDLRKSLWYLNRINLGKVRETNTDERVLRLVHKAMDIVNLADDSVNSARTWINTVKQELLRLEGEVKNQKDNAD